MDLFGSRMRTRLLLFVAVAEESYTAEIVHALDAKKLTIQRMLQDLEIAGIVASRLRGRVRLVSLDKTWYAAAELRALLERMASAEPAILEAAAAIRRRPRRSGKPL